MTQFPWFKFNIAGRLPFKLEELHDRYGTVVRIGPKELSYVATSVDTWKTIYAHKPVEMMKNLHGTGPEPPVGGRPGIVQAEQPHHARMRKMLLPAFSEKAVRAQERYISFYTRWLIAILRERASDSNPVDVVKFLTLTTFDLGCDLTFGESFEGLEKQDYHPWVRAIAQFWKAIPVMQLLNYYGLFKYQMWLTPKRMKEERGKFWALTREKLDARLQRKKGRDDFIGFILRDPANDQVLDMDELHMNATILTVAGSETVASHLSSVVYYLLLFPEKLAKLCKEIRSAFIQEDDITIESASQLQYLRCVMQECLRLHPPSPSTISRVVPSGKGENICGRWVPAGVSLMSSQHSSGS